jgi:FkbM family methyltransferase
MTTPFSQENPVQRYWAYLYPNESAVNASTLSELSTHFHNTAWDEPVSTLDFNNIAVMALIEVERSDDQVERWVSLEFALEALTQGANLAEHPLCQAHLILIRSLLGDAETAGQQALSTLIDVLQDTYNSPNRLPLGLVYLPHSWASEAIARSETLQQLLHAEDGYKQTLLLLSHALYHLQVVFYNSTGLRFLQLATHLSPNAASLNLKLGIASFLQKQWEGFLYLQQARYLQPDWEIALQALYLAYRHSSQPELASFWLETARSHRPQDASILSWKWTELPVHSSFTYVVYEGMLLAVEPKIRSIVTSVLLAEGDWFEAEIEFWREQVRSGMTVIDVGANVGVYTFSAARRVTSTGRVLAVEPFSTCIRCLRETCQINHWDWVTICPGAASDRNGFAHLALQSVNEMNQVIDAAAPGEASEQIVCFTLDHLVEREQLTQVDWLKIDAEGHELQILLGSHHLLSRFKPKIMYENAASTNFYEITASNRTVAELLTTQGYQLYRYRPYIRDLVAIESFDQLRGNLNIIALPL